MYVFLQMPQNTFLAVAILSASAVLYPHYATLVRHWGPTPLDDQQLAAGIMWIAGDLIFLTAIMASCAAGCEREARDAARADRQADAERGRDPRPRGAASPSGWPTSAERPLSATASAAGSAPRGIAR